MNNQILEQYELSFNIIIDANNNRTAVVYGTELSLYLDYYLMSGNYKEFYEEELIPEINNAIQGNSYDEDGGGDITFLTLGYPFSYIDINDGTSPQQTISTVDLKEIILSWIEFLEENNMSSNFTGNDR